MSTTTAPRLKTARSCGRKRSRSLNTSQRSSFQDRTSCAQSGQLFAKACRSVPGTACRNISRWVSSIACEGLCIWKLVSTGMRSTALLGRSRPLMGGTHSSNETGPGGGCLVFHRAVVGNASADRRRRFACKFTFGGQCFSGVTFGLYKTVHEAHYLLDHI